MPMEPRQGATELTLAQCSMNVIKCNLCFITSHFQALQIKLILVS